MGLLSKAKDSVEKAKSGLKNIGNRLGRATKDQQELQDEINYYNDLEGQVEDEIGAGKTDAADREARELEDMDQEIAQKIRDLDQEVHQVLEEELEDLKLIAKAFNQREQFEASTKETIRNIAEDHGNFDQELQQAIQNLERYIEENKDSEGSLYRGNVGRHAQSDEGRNWQNLARTANSLRKEMRGIVEREQEMLQLLQEEDRTLEQFKEEWEESLKDVQNLKQDLEYYYAGEEELEGIARKLEDSQLMQSVQESERGTKTIRDMISQLDQMIGQIDGVLNDLEQEDERVLSHQSNVEERAETIKHMSVNALEAVEGARAIVEGDKYPDLSVNSRQKWMEEINTIENAMQEVQELVENFEEIEEKEIQVEREEENILETEAREGRTALGDD
ncbi:MAG: hypothetical protein ABEJ69_01635 [Candidatus Nanohaloarchaea archaeon]